MTERTAKSGEIQCPRCGEVGTGRFCGGCGSPLRDASCSSCGQPLETGARFCHNCGTPAIAAGFVTKRMSDGAIAKFVGLTAVLMLVAYVAGRMFAQRSSGAADVASAQQSGSITPASTPTAPDISNMSPEERANRLFDRVMRYSEEGKADSARFFAPMAIQAYQMIGPLDAHSRYDIGQIAAAIGEASMAKLEADSILVSQPNHLLGLVLAIRAAKLAGDKSAEANFHKRLVAAVATERGKNLKEYTEHSRDIDLALGKP